MEHYVGIDVSQDTVTRELAHEPLPGLASPASAVLVTVKVTASAPDDPNAAEADTTATREHKEKARRARFRPLLTAVSST